MNQKPTGGKKELTQELLRRGVDSIYPSPAALAKRLKAARRLRVYFGVDPSGADLHIGHMIPLQKLRQFQELGHEVILLVGDFTGQTGDPSDKQATRKPLTKQQVLKNAQYYRQQAATTLNFGGKNPVKLRYNSGWLDRLGFDEVAELADHFTVQQLVERDMFEQRLRAGKPISLREFLYPLMQGYDSVAMKVDVEVGGTDQTFNMLAGRKLVREYLGKEKFVLTVPLLADNRGVKIGKSEGNAIKIAGKPHELYGQVMALPDEVIVGAFEQVTSVPQAEVAAMGKLVKRSPRDAKMKLAYAIVCEFQGTTAAERGQRSFVRIFQQKNRPIQIPSWKSPTMVVPLWKAMKESGLVRSSSEAHRLVAQGAVHLNDQPQSDPNAGVKAIERPVLQVGKKNFLRVVR